LNLEKTYQKLKIGHDRTMSIVCKKKNNTILYQWGYTGLKNYFCKNVLNGINNGGTQKQNFMIFPSPVLKNHIHFNFSSYLMKKLLKTFFKPPHQSTSKDFNQIGTKLMKKMLRIWYWFGL